MSPLLFVNPRSGDGGPDALLAAARARGIRTHLVREQDDLAALSREAGADVDALGMAGGDGSLAVVAEAAMERRLPEEMRTPIEFGVERAALRVLLPRDPGA